MAEHERLRHADAFRRADASAAERGIHVASRVPVGYLGDLDALLDELSDQDAMREVLDSLDDGWRLVRRIPW